MSDTATDLSTHRSLLRIERVASQGMIALRGGLGSAALGKGLRKATGLAVPGLREIAHDETGAFGVAWMSPDELMILTPPGVVHETIAQLHEGLAGNHATLADMSDARAVFALEGAPVRDVLAKLCPVDFAPEAFPAGAFRRTRAAQVAVAVWFTAPEAARLICFRSVAGYVEELLCTASAPGGEVGLYHR
ncbi:sarcosine oxidase subunit gamma [Alkalilacustris brevis]|uniref:sarcosine oxidase subunit gamma n=1 Tax=Alkalilacustris brevis TaxID=2026338 RepID=UPI000E0CC2ED|nr:sarcosine oxidase subunit gamma family protein [Alkalilacustris brevis]